jgi:tRNA/rRNA methyltransferase
MKHTFNMQIILVQTSHAGNLGSVARAMKVMGLSDLTLVSPQANHLSAEAIAMASHADDILRNARVVETLAQALKDSHLQFALSARTRYYSPPLVYLNDICVFLMKTSSHIADPSSSIAFVFGPERTGLTNEDVMQCSHLLNIHTNPDYASLNLAQAVQLVSYELHRFLFSGQSLIQNKPCIDSRQNDEIPLATHEQIQGMHQHLLQALTHLNYQQNPQFPQRLMQLWHKSRLNTEEVNIIRGISKLIIKKQ